MAAINRHVTMELETHYEEEQEMTTAESGSSTPRCSTSPINIPFKNQHGLLSFRKSQYVFTCSAVLRSSVLTPRLLSFVM